MDLPVRCFTCGKPLRNHDFFLSQTQNGEEPEKVLDKMGYQRMCCRRMFLTCPQITDILLMYTTPLEEQLGKRS